MEEKNITPAELQMWEQRRFEIAKDVTVALIEKLSYQEAISEPNNKIDEMIACRAIEIAEEVIWELHYNKLDL